MVYGLGERLKGCRLSARLSQKQVAEMIGVTPSSICGYESGEVNPGLEVLLKLSAVYKCSTDYLLKGKENLPAAVSLESDKVQNCG